MVAAQCRSEADDEGVFDNYLTMHCTVLHYPLHTHLSSQLDEDSGSDSDFEIEPRKPLSKKKKVVEQSRLLLIRRIPCQSSHRRSRREYFSNTSNYSDHLQIASWQREEDLLLSTAVPATLMIGTPMTRFSRVRTISRVRANPTILF